MKNRDRIFAAILLNAAFFNPGSSHAVEGIWSENLSIPSANLLEESAVEFDISGLTHIDYKEGGGVAFRVTAGLPNGFEAGGVLGFRPGGNQGYKVETIDMFALGMKYQIPYNPGNGSLALELGIASAAESDSKYVEGGLLYSYTLGDKIQFESELAYYEDAIGELDRFQKRKILGKGMRAGIGIAYLSSMFTPMMEIIVWQFDGRGSIAEWYEDPDNVTLRSTIYNLNLGFARDLTDSISLTLGFTREYDVRSREKENYLSGALTYLLD
jgi:hypothetical protein